ncbi:MAG: hypothetical protein ACOYMG_12910 [Candidatus Methylumidiphilus sp.]
MPFAAHARRRRVGGYAPAFSYVHENYWLIVATPDACLTSGPHDHRAAGRPGQPFRQSHGLTATLKAIAAIWQRHHLALNNLY